MKSCTGSMLMASPAMGPWVTCSQPFQTVPVLKRRSSIRSPSESGRFIGVVLTKGASGWYGMSHGAAVSRAVSVGDCQPAVSDGHDCVSGQAVAVGAGEDAGGWAGVFPWPIFLHYRRSSSRDGGRLCLRG